MRFTAYELSFVKKRWRNWGKNRRRIGGLRAFPSLLCFHRIRWYIIFFSLYNFFLYDETSFCFLSRDIMLSCRRLATLLARPGASKTHLYYPYHRRETVYGFPSFLFRLASSRSHRLFTRFPYPTLPPNNISLCIFSSFHEIQEKNKSVIDGNIVRLSWLLGTCKEI